jgi:membrane-bound lytic murein transglycosylase B
VLQQSQLKQSEKQKQDLVIAARGQESVYLQLIASKQQTAAQIEAQLFNLRDTTAVSFGDMYNFAKEASLKTGVRPAFILAILSQESDLGANIGSCYVTNLQTGDGVGKSSGEIYQRVMKAPRDTDPYLAITQQFQLPWATTAVSCPLGHTYTSSRGYGGAMGPAQFIPSTWQLYADRISAAMGQGQSNPWDPHTATFAIALYMADLGADQQTSTAERNAALKYFAGSQWQNSAYGFYGRQVMQKVDDFERQIQVLGG